MRILQKYFYVYQILLYSLALKNRYIFLISAIGYQFFMISLKIHLLFEIFLHLKIIDPYFIFTDGIYDIGKNEIVSNDIILLSKKLSQKNKKVIYKWT